MLPRGLGLFGARRHGRAGARVFLFGKPFACQCPVWRHVVGFMFACGCVGVDCLTMLAVVFGCDEQVLSGAAQALKVSIKVVSHAMP